jgi:hypothetical protein
MKARIHQRPKSSMQSGKAKVGQWLLDYEPAEAKRLDPLTGWTGSGDTSGQVLLAFDKSRQRGGVCDGQRHRL